VDKMSKATTIGPERSKCGFARALPAALLASLACLLFASPAAAAPAWLVPTELSAPGRDASEPALAMGESGETVAVWQRQSETEIGQTVQASTRSPGAAFSTPLELSAAAGEPTVAMTPSGEAVALWRHFFQEEGKGYYAIQASYRPPGGSFSAPLDVAVLPSAALPQDIHVAIDAAGDTAAVWTQQEESTSVIEASLRPAGAGFSTPTTISPTPLVPGHSAQGPRVAIDAAGEAAAAWAYDNGTNEVIQASTASPGGSFSAPVDLSAPGGEAGAPAIAMTPTGDVTAVWTRSNDTNYIIETSTASPGDSFSAPVELSDPSHSAFEPELAIDPAGDAVAVWTYENGTNDVIQASTAGPGGSFSSPVELSESGQNASNPELSINPGAAVAVVWQRSNGENEIVQASTGSTTSGFSSPVDLSAPGQDAFFPMVAIDNAGDATAVWKRSNGANEIVEAAGYDADAPLLRDLSIPSSGTVGVPLTFSASPFDVWPIASTSFNFGDGANAQGTSVSHTYSARGTYQVTVTSTDAAGTPVSAERTITILPSDEFAIGRLSRNRKRGTATFLVTVPGPGKLVLFGKGVKKATRRPERAGRLKLPIVARGKARKRLLRRGSVRVPLAIAFTPNGGATHAKHKKVTLIKRPTPKRRARR
jgi:PKD domain